MNALEQQRRFFLFGLAGLGISQVLPILPNRKAQRTGSFSLI